MDLLVSFQGLTPAAAFLACLFLALIYVGSLYIWTSNLPRDDPLTIKERFRRVFFACVASVIFIYQISSKKDSDGSYHAHILKWLGIRRSGLLAAATLPLLLFMVLFMGPLYQSVLEGGGRCLTSTNWKDLLTDLRCWRNYIVAPFSEELVFRGCMLPILLPAFGPLVSILLAPTFFGIAHVHHAWEKYYRDRYPIGPVIVSTLFQASYTSIFGGLSSWLFLRTGHLTSVVVSHAFCNMMGFPDFEGALSHKRRSSICLAYILGLIMFFYLANTLTAPTLYVNTLYDGA